MIKDAAGMMTVKGRTFDAAKRYRYTWPGGKSVIVSGEDMAAVAESADPQLLEIHEVYPTIPPKAIEK